MKKAFTLVELLVVIGILGILVGTLVMSFGKGTEQARTVKCATNMKNLAAAAIAEGYPFAQSAQYMDVDISRYGGGGSDGGKMVYGVHRGWISFLDKDVKYPLSSPGEFQQCSFASSDADEKWHALTNGAIWKAIGGNRECYLCPAFVRECRKAGVQDPAFSYQMNAYFGYEKQPGKAMATKNSHIIHPTRADRRLMFAEIQALTLSSSMASQSGVGSLPQANLTGGNGTPECDCCLLPKSKAGASGGGSGESIGFNHRRGREIFGHVAFSDGHVESFSAPKSGNFVDLTDWLCDAKDVVNNNGNYEEIKNALLD